MSRTRSRNQPTITAPAQMYRNGAPLYSPRTTTISAHSESMVDTVTPGWRRLQGKTLVNNPCSYSKETIVAGGGDWSTTNGTYTYSISGGSTTQYMLAYSPPSGASSASCSSETSLAAAAKARAIGNVDRAPFSIAEDIAEMRQTVSLLRNPLQSIHRLSDSVFRRRINPINNKGISTSLSLAEVWATVRWGYFPLMQSVETIVASLGYDVVDTANSVILSSHGKAEDSGKIIQPDLRRTYGSNYDKFYHSHAIERKVRAYVLYRNYNPIRDWRYKYGLRARDVPELLWAITPWSHMIDRITSISTSLRGLSALSSPSIEIVGGGVVSKTDTYEVWKYITQHEPPYVSSGSGDDYVTHNFSFGRTLWSPSVLDTFVESDFGNLVKDVTSIVDLVAAIRLLFR